MKRFFYNIIVYTLLLCLALPGITVYAEETEATQPPVRAANECGDDLVWVFEEGTLSIIGTGAMDPYTLQAPPWSDHKEEITKVVISDGVTTVGDEAFMDYDAITSVSFGSDVTELGVRSFSGCDGLTSITLPRSFKNFAEECLRGCRNLTQIHCEGVFPHFRLNCLWDTYCTIYFPASRPWSVTYIQQLEEAFHNRIAFLASDGSDPYTPTEPTEETKETTQPTEASTEPPTTAAPETTVPETTVPETTQPETTAPTQAATVPTQPHETQPETEAPETTVPPTTQPPVPTSGGKTVALALVVFVFAFLALGALLVHGPRHRGRYE